MTYLRIRPDCGGIRRECRSSGNGKKAYEGEFIANELYTPAEARRYRNVEINCEHVEIKKTQTNHAFGARFGLDRPYGWKEGD